MADDEKSSDNGEKEHISAFGELDDSVLAAATFSSVLEDAVQPLQEFPFDAVLQQQIAPILAVQESLAQQPLLDIQQELEASLQPLIKSPAFQLQYSITPALAASIGPSIQEMKIQSMMPALQAFEELRTPAIQVAAALDEIQTVDYAVSEFSAASASASEPVVESHEPSDSLSEDLDLAEREESSTVEWTTYNWLEIYYSLSANLLDEAIDASGVRDLSEKQRVGVCLTVALLIYATTSKKGFFEISTPAALLYTVLQDFAEE